MKSGSIVNSEIEDLDFACYLFQEAIKYQKKHGYPEYRWDERTIQEEYIKKQQHYKLIKEGQIAAIFNVQFSDKEVWGELDKGDSIYLHGIVVNPHFKGQKLFSKILAWSIQLAREKKRSSIRMDTWDDNPNLTNYYLDFGFQIVKHSQMPDGPDVPLNRRGNKAVLMEFKLNSSAE